MTKWQLNVKLGPKVDNEAPYGDIATMSVRRPNRGNKARLEWPPLFLARRWTWRKPPSSAVPRAHFSLAGEKAGARAGAMKINTGSSSHRGWPQLRMGAAEGLKFISFPHG